jgi:oxygen-independent coproporphyrinogen-3 oxidase
MGVGRLAPIAPGVALPLGRRDFFLYRREQGVSDIAQLFAARVPRYTSYPTAPNFHAGVDEDIYRNWLAALDSSTPLSLYVHIPFCDTLCWFCGCHTTVVNRYAPVSDYLDVLLEEIALIAGACGSGGHVTHLHWGGGSPTMLRVADIERLGAALRAAFPFAAGSEFATEIDPRGFRAETAEALVAAGLTRASIGIQDCNAEVQQAINRRQSNEETAHAVSLLRGLGVGSLNIDLVYGLPHQSVESVLRTIDFAVSLDPDRLAVFGYAHVPHFKKHMALIPEKALPGVDERFRQYEAVRERLVARGYVPVGLDHFAKPGDGLARMLAEGRLSRNFQGYTTDTASALIGLGASAIGALPQGYVQNIADVPGYRSAVHSGRLPIARGVALSSEDRLHRAAIERLMCDMKVDLAVLARSYGAGPDAFAGALDRLAPLLAKNIAVYDGTVLSVPDAWRSAVRLVCAEFDTYLEAGSRHALAV